MSFPVWLREFARCSRTEDSLSDEGRSIAGHLRTDGGEGQGEENETEENDEMEGSGVERSNIEITEAGETEPADPKWEKPDPDDIPEFEVRADEPVAGGGDTTDVPPKDPTAGMPNTARSPGQTRIKEDGIEGYIVALELCARLPDDVRLPEEAADLVPAAVEAELENDVQSFAAAEFDNPSPHVDTLSFVEADGEVWLRLRLGVPPEAFDHLDPDEIRSHALQQLEGLF